MYWTKTAEHLRANMKLQSSRLMCKEVFGCVFVFFFIDRKELIKILNPPDVQQ